MSAAEPVRDGEGADIVGPRNADREQQNPFTVRPPASDHGTIDYRAGDVGYVPFAMGYYIENTGSGPLRFLEMFAAIDMPICRSTNGLR
jgi:oxalate decarboxylase/phosphoglucose isomerase-like protein (cupin superfamily)